MNYATSYQHCVPPEVLIYEPTEAETQARAAVLLQRMKTKHPRPFADLAEGCAWADKPFADAYHARDIHALGQHLLIALDAEMARRAEDLAEAELSGDMSREDERLLGELRA